MNKKIIQFSHGNSYPAGCYKQFLAPLEKKFQVNAVEMFGHHPDYPVTDGWKFLVKELIDNIEAYSDKPVIGLGHSFGGVLTVMAASERPDLFEKIFILDSPIFGRLKSVLIKWIKRIGLIDRVTPGGKTLARKRHWANQQDALEYLKKKTVFKRFTQQCLEDYVRYGMEVTPDGLQLKYDVETEYKIYRTIPHDLRKIKHKLTVPMTLIYGESSDVVKNNDLKAMQKEFKSIVFHKMPGTHLFPFEYPEETTGLILNEIG
jgi:pimeloyl-ACP methyl ester carboxylesterase